MLEKDCTGCSSLGILKAWSSDYNQFPWHAAAERQISGPNLRLYNLEGNPKSQKVTETQKSEILRYLGKEGTSHSVGI